MSESTVSHALRLLRTSEVVATRRAGQSLHCRLADPHVRQLPEISREHLVEELGPQE